MNRFRMGLVVLAALVAMVAVSGQAIGGSAGVAGKEATVKLGDDFFSPAKKTVKKGTVVRFKWIGSKKHNVVKKKGPGGGFASPLTSSPGINFKKRFKKKGKYKLICTIHSGMDMVLKVK